MIETRLARILLLAALTSGVVLASPQIASAGKNNYTTCCWKVEVTSDGSMSSDWGPKDPDDAYSGTHSYAWEWEARTLVAYFHDYGDNSDFGRCPAFTEAFRCAPLVRSYTVRESSDFGGGNEPCMDGDTSDGWKRRGGELLSLAGDPPLLRVHPLLGYDDQCCQGDCLEHTVQGQECLPPALACYDNVFDAFFQVTGSLQQKHFSDRGKEITPRVYTPGRPKGSAAFDAWSFDFPAEHDSQNGHVTTGGASTTILFRAFPSGTVAHPGKRWKHEIAQLKKLG